MRAMRCLPAYVGGERARGGFCLILKVQCIFILGQRDAVCLRWICIKIIIIITGLKMC